MEETHLPKLPQKRKERQRRRDRRHRKWRKHREIRRRENHPKPNARKELIADDIAHGRVHARKPNQDERRDRQRPARVELWPIGASLGDGEPGEHGCGRGGEREREEGGAGFEGGESFAGLEVDREVDYRWDL